MKRAFIGVTLLLVLAAGGAWWWVRQSLPSLDGEWRLAGLGGPVEVLSDGYGVPHVYARDTADAWFVAGALHARDRRWQMELYRRAAYGRLSEVLGATTLPIDKRMLTLGIRAAAEKELARLGPAARAALTRYAEGVNAATTGLTGRQRPLEFQLLGATPDAWAAVDSLAIGRLLAWRLAENANAELVRHALARALGAGAADALTGRYPDAAPTVLGELAEFPAPAPVVPPAPTAPTPAPVSAAPSQAAATPIAYPPGLGWLNPSAPRANSNAWVIAASRTTSGRPILANDPHLPVEMPAVWYEMHLVAAGLDVQGVSVPGTPFIAIGHNARIAWGLTNTGADVQDLVLQKFDLARRRVEGPAGWEAVQVESAPIPVKGRSTPEPFEIWRTSHGPVFADESLDWEAPPAWLSPDGTRQGESRAFVLRWEGFDGGYADAFEAVNRAGTWTEFQAAFDQLSALSQNVVYADVDGNIGYLMTGQLPSRGSGDGTQPVSAGSAAWGTPVGGPGALPRVLNPARGYLVTTNNPVLRGGTPFITRDWMGQHRAQRVTAVVDAASTGMDVGKSATLQNDIESPAGRQVMAGIDGAIARGRKVNADARVMTFLEGLKAWTGVVDGSELTARYEAFEDRLWRRALGDDLAPELFHRYYQWAGAERPAGLYSFIDDPQARWWDDIGTVNARETRDDIYLLAAGDAASDVEQWAAKARGWDRVHSVTFAHPLSAGGRALAWFFDRGPVPASGDGTTVMRISSKRLDGFGAWEHPSWRQVLDVGGWDTSKVVLPAGQSGNPMSPHYFDQNALWRQGQYRTLAYSRGAVNGAASHRQLVVP